MYQLSAFGLSFERLLNGSVRIVKKEGDEVIMYVTISEGVWAKILDDLRS